MRDGDNFYALTGEMIREWVNLEQSLSLWLTDLLGVDEARSRIVWNSYGDLRSKLNLLKALVRNFAADGAWEEAREILSRTETIAEDRFIVAHTFGQVDAGVSRLAFVSDKADKDFIIDLVSEKAVDTRALGTWLEGIRECQDSARAFRTKLVNRVHATTLAQRRVSHPRS
jgi:hypothetical protein